MTVKKFFQIFSLLLFAGLFMAGCTQAATDEQLAASQEGVTNFGNIASASGKVVPANWAMLGLESGGRITWLVDEGTEVAAGDILARLDTQDQETAVAQAQAAHASVMAQLKKARTGATAEEIAAANGAVLAAEGHVAAAEARLAQVESKADLGVDMAEAALAQAQGAREAAQAEQARAQAEYSRIQSGATAEEIAFYEAKLAQAEAELRFPINVHDQILDHDVGGPPEEQARFKVEAAQAARDAARAQLAMIRAGATASELAAANAAIRAAQAQVTIAEAGVTAAEVTLVEAQSAANDIAEARAQRQITEGQLAQAEAERDQLIAGATEEELAVLQAQVDQASAALEEARMKLAKTTLVAPFAGTVGVVYAKVGEVIAPSTMASVPVLVLGDTSELRVETTDLNEVDAARVVSGGPVSLSFDALPGQTIEGTIIFLAPMASEGQGGTNFKAAIEMASPPEELRWGMTAFVDVELD